MIEYLKLPADMPDRSMYFKYLSKEYSMPMDAIWALYNSDVTEKEFYEHLKECEEKNWYGWSEKTRARNKLQYCNKK